MAELIIVHGPSGSGKTMSLRNVDPKKSIYIKNNNKMFPWRSGSKDWGNRAVRVKSLEDIPALLQKCAMHGITQVFIDDYTHLQNATILSEQFMLEGLNDSTKWSRYDRFGRLLYTSIYEQLDKLPTNMFIVLFAHTDDKHQIKVAGQMGKRDIDPVSYCNIVLSSQTNLDNEGKPVYTFITNRDGIHEAKSPNEMFAELNIENDIQMVLDTARAYYGMESQGSHQATGDKEEKKQENEPQTTK